MTPIEFVSTREYLPCVSQYYSNSECLRAAASQVAIILVDLYAKEKDVLLSMFDLLL